MRDRSPLHNPQPCCPVPLLLTCWCHSCVLSVRRLQVRVPFNTIVLGLEEVQAIAVAERKRDLLSDVRMMQTAAEGMQRYVWSAALCACLINCEPPRWLARCCTLSAALSAPEVWWCAAHHHVQPHHSRCSC